MGEKHPIKCVFSYKRVRFSLFDLPNSKSLTLHFCSIVHRLMKNVTRNNVHTRNYSQPLKHWSLLIKIKRHAKKKSLILE